MEWNTKWDWENHEIFNSKVIEEEIDGSFNLSSDVVNNSSISASTESSLKEGIKVFAGGLPESSRNKKELAGAGTAASPAMEGSVSSGELFIGLKLGKRTYFENSFVKGSSKVSSFSDVSGKKVKSSCQSTVIPLCQVEGCNLDLSSAKEYHRKHRVCESHSKCPKVVVGGLERRFCQQCSRFHSLSEFDEKKRSCRRRLSDHNARRRKPQQETIHFNSSSLSSSFYDGTQQLSFVLNNAPLIQTRPVVNSTWENTSKADKCGVGDDMSLELPNGVNKPTTLAFNGLVPSKGTRGEVLDQGFKESLSSDVDALDIRRALSLLSNDSWGGGVCDPPDLMQQHHHHHHNNNNNPNVLHIQQPLPQGLFPLSSPEYWHNEQQHSIDNPHKTIISNAANNNTQFQDFHLFNRYYSNPIDEILKPL